MKIISLLKRCLVNPFHILVCKLRNNTIPLSTIIDGFGYMKGCKVGKYCFIGDRFNFNYVQIGNYSCIGTNVQIGGMEHSINDFSISPLLFPENCIDNMTTSIGHDVWICGHVIIKQGVKIGDGAVIGANSFVNKDVEPYAVVAGSPARFIKYRPAKENLNNIVKSEYWNFSPKVARELLYNIKNK